MQNDVNLSAVSRSSEVPVSLKQAAHSGEYLNSRYPSIELLRARAKRRMPGFAFDYLEGGCFSDINLVRNRTDLQSVCLRPYYLRDFEGADMSVTLFGSTYSAPFGIAPIGLQGLMWPNATEILAKAARVHRLPFTLSTVGTASIERVSELTEGDFWFQLYHPADDALRDKLLGRAADAGARCLVLLADTPTFAYRPKEIRNGLSIPPRLSLSNILQMCAKPRWALGQLRHGAPEFQTLKPYIPKGLSIKHLGEFMNRTFSGRLTVDKLSAIRDQWKGPILVKGIVCEEDVEAVIRIGVDGIVVSNHGGRQLDVGESTLAPLRRLSAKYSNRLSLLMDSGVRSGADVAVAIACGAKAVLLGRTFMYGVAALGERGGDHTATMLRRQLQQVMEQVGCPRLEELPHHLV